MSRRFVIAVSDVGEAERDAITNAIKAKWAWWHWMPDLWLIVTPDDVDSKAVRNLIQAAAKNTTTVVLEAPRANPDWSAYGFKGMFKWFHETWK